MDARSGNGATVDYDEAPLRLFHLRTAVASSGGVFSDEYGLGIIGISLSHAALRLSLSPVWMGLLGGASLLGLFAGALFTGPKRLPIWSTFTCPNFSRPTYALPVLGLRSRPAALDLRSARSCYP